ncbi:IclR family transcriptional regulator [Pseudooceanicola sediminis]|uniref:IclR family transcriptional regulator n=1 Tax=Pseudooceanicola sediminis TaxID=2211117 RepID=A0A399J1X6_9RHOB|nr:IclR family transcriptional regulator [Pseudooceanicola sediminis]RII38637.1 IclR family transcriptional regulator [Pseudooceanicola sediminis]|tara:strand:- start:10266 stop:11234 length:969 start_codon:yes stop_codon:yes gene_type:complete
MGHSFGVDRGCRAESETEETRSMPIKQEPDATPTGADDKLVIPPGKKPPQGSQTVDKAMRLLKIIAGGSSEGLRLMDLAEQSGLDRATAYRLVTSLANHNFVDQDMQSKRYTLGLEFFALASAASNRHDLSDRAREALEHLSEVTGDTAMYCLRSGLDVICMDVQMGNFPVRTMPMDIGSRKPIGAGATGIAMLAPLPDPEIEDILARAAPRLAKVPGSDAESIRREVALCRERGWALAADDPQGRIMGLSLCLTSRNNRPVGALTLNGIPERFADDRVAGLAALLREEARELADQLDRLPETERHRTRWSGKRTARSQNRP